MIEALEVYLVGGAVRDALLGRSVGDRDWVVVGSTPQQMEALGFTPVGKDFPVYLHPESREEYALARTERKQGRGHRGFVVHAEPTVTLEEDLERRDLTINAIAQDHDGRLIDPFNGVSDLKQKVLRHVSPAFAEDPLRVFRVARFAAQLADFEVAGETLTLMQGMAAAGELRDLFAERVWQELQKALEANAPQRFFAVLDAADCLDDWFPEFTRDDRADPSTLLFKSADAVLRFAELPLQAEEFAHLNARLKVPRMYAQTAADWLSWREVLGDWRTAPAEKVCDALEALKAAHEPVRLQRLLSLLTAYGVTDTSALLALAEGWKQIKVRQKDLAGPAVGAALRSARVEFIEAARG